MGDPTWEDTKMTKKRVSGYSLGRTAGRSLNLFKNFPGSKQLDRRFEGEWSNGKQHGIGTFYTAENEKKVGEWVQGKRVRWEEES